MFRGMNIHLPAILMLTRGYKVLTHCHMSFICLSMSFVRWLCTKTSPLPWWLRWNWDHLTGLTDIAVSLWVTENGGILTHSHFGGLEHDFYFSIKNRDVLPIDELIFFKMVIAPPTSHLNRTRMMNQLDFGISDSLFSDKLMPQVARFCQRFPAISWIRCWLAPKVATKCGGPDGLSEGS